MEFEKFVTDGDAVTGGQIDKGGWPEAKDDLEWSAVCLLNRNGWLAAAAAAAKAAPEKLGLYLRAAAAAANPAGKGG